MKRNEVFKQVDTLTQNEANRLLTIAQLKRRDHLMILLMLDAGLRVGEMIALRVCNCFDFKFNVKSSITVVMKNTKTKNHSREVPISNRLAKILQSYFDHHIISPVMRRIAPDLRSKLIAKGLHTGTGATHYYNLSLFTITKRQTQRIIQSLGFDAIGRKITPHILRHTFATRLISANINIRIIQVLLGHRSLQSTQIYTHPSRDDLHNAIGQLDEGFFNSDLLLPFKSSS